MSQYIFPDHLKYTKEHEWVDLSQEIAIVGITEYAVKSLHDIVYVSLPEVGSTIKQFQVVATVESIKSVSEIYSPLSGTIVDVNKILETNPEKINLSPYKEGWLFKIKPSNLDSDVKNLMSAEEYRRYIESLKKIRYTLAVTLLLFLTAFDYATYPGFEWDHIALFGLAPRGAAVSSNN